MSSAFQLYQTFWFSQNSSGRALNVFKVDETMLSGKLFHNGIILTAGREGSEGEGKGSTFWYLLTSPGPPSSMFRFIIFVLIAERYRSG